MFTNIITKVYANHRQGSVKNMGCQLWWHNIMIANYYYLITDNMACLVLKERIFSGSKKLMKRAEQAIIEYFDELDPTSIHYINHIDSPFD